MRLLASARSADLERAAAARRPAALLARCRRRILGLVTVEERCVTSRAA